MGALVAGVSGWLNVPVFAFPLVKIVTQGQLCQQLVRPVVYMYFRFFACKNHNAGAAVSGRLYVFVFAFPLVKIVTRGQLCQQLVRPVEYMYFRFFACKNHNAGAAAAVAGQVTRTCFRFFARKNRNAKAAMPVAGQTFTHPFALSFRHYPFPRGGGGGGRTRTLPSSFMSRDRTILSIAVPAYNKLSCILSGNNSLIPLYPGL